MSKNDDGKILTIFSYTRFGQEAIIAGMNYSYLFDDENFANTHEVLYDKDFSTITDMNQLKSSEVYHTDSGESFTLKRSLKGTYEVNRLN